MKIKRLRPTSPGKRFSIKLVNKNLYKGKPFSKLTMFCSKKSGRNNQGKITTRHKWSGHKKKYRLIDFFRPLNNVPAFVNRIEYDPNRTANIALINYSNGLKKYIICPKGLKIGDEVISNKSAPIKTGNCMLIKNIPLGTIIHNVEIKYGKGAQISRSAGSYVQMINKDKFNASVRLKSGEIRKVNLNCRATVGTVSNLENNLKVIGKAGTNRWLGKRPTVRGVAMNPIDHPHGGGEGKTSGGRHPSNPSGVKTKGKKTRRKKYSNNMIIKKRK